jgi:prophage antirepressor-like protein
MNNLQVFKYGDNEVRTVQKNGEPWWVLKDVCEALGLSNAKMVAQRIDEDERGKFDLPRQGETWIVNESGLYNVILRSDKPEAKQFKRWVTHEVLPAIRKTGTYTTPKSRPHSLSEINAAARIIRETLKEAGMSPPFVAVAVKSLYAPVGVEFPLDGITASKKTYDCATIAKRLGLYSKTGNPHSKAVAAIIQELGYTENETELVPYQNTFSGHSGTTTQYADSVINRVSLWLDKNNRPDNIGFGGKSYSVQYEQG